MGGGGAHSDTTPDKAAYVHARKAKLRQIAGHDFSSDLIASQNLLETIHVAPKNRPSPDCLRAHALICGIQHAFIERLTKPNLAELVEYTAQGAEISDILLESKESGLRNVALALSEKDRAEYLLQFPEDKRGEISLILDLYVSKTMHSNVPTTDEEKEQMRLLETRGSETLKQLVQSGDFAKLPSHLKLVCLTLAELDSVESVHALHQAGAYGLDKEHVRPKGASRKEILQRWSGFARILKTESDIPSVEANAGMLGMKYLALVDLPDKLFDFFLRKMVQTGFLTLNVQAFPTSEPANKELLHELITKYPSQFNTIVDTIASIEGFNAKRHSKDVLDALTHLHTLVPATFEAYLLGNYRERSQLLDRIRKSRARLYENLPVEKNGSPPEVPLPEHVYMATEPVNMSFTRFMRMYNRLTDRTFDLHRYKFPWEGYSFELRGAGQSAPKLKSGQEVQTDVLRFYRDTLSIEGPTSGSEGAKNLTRVLEGLVKGGTLQARDKNLGLLMSLLADDSSRKEYLAEFQTPTADNAYEFILSTEPFYEEPEMQELFSQKLREFLDVNNENSQRILNQLKNPERFKTLVKRIEAATKQGFHLGVEVPEQISDTKDAADLLTAAMYATVLAPARREISKEKKKFETPRDKRDVKNIDNLKAYVSKNVAAFFARAAVGICTFEDVSSWNRENYFHINIVEDDEHLRANIQAFVVRLKDKPVLLLRGINPNAPFLKRINAGAFCEEILKIARQFQEENGLEGVHISEQAEWHALSNRQPVSEYLIDKYVKPENEVMLPKPMVMSKTIGLQTISKMYKVS